MKIIVVKISGSIVDSLQHDGQWTSAITRLSGTFDGVVLVHGAGGSISAWSEAFKLKPQFQNGQRVTCRKTLEIVAAVQSGLVNATIVSTLQSRGIAAIGLTGIDRGLFIGLQTDKALGYVGKPYPAASADWVVQLACQKTVPVFSSLCRNSAGDLLNVNADIFTQSLAQLLSAHTVLFVSDVEGIMIDGRKADFLTESEINDCIAKGIIHGGMVPKVTSALSLVKTGTKAVWIGNQLIGMDFHALKSGAEYRASKSSTEYRALTQCKGTWIVAGQ
ncbi:MAG: acetylglutamate kinase [Chitinivibrionales bacterium]|nr:acetylglutamate kinase [Chitinivibrionales bacterium]